MTQSLLFGSTIQGDNSPGSIQRPVWAKATADSLLLTSVLFEAQVCCIVSTIMCRISAGMIKDDEYTVSDVHSQLACSQRSTCLNPNCNSCLFNCDTLLMASAAGFSLID